MKQIETIYKKPCLYCDSGNICYPDYSRHTEEMPVYSKDSADEIPGFKGENCKRMFYCRGSLQ